jgi:transposase
MKQVSTIGLDLAKKLFQVHGVDAAGTVVVRRALRRGQVLAFFARLPRCLVGMEACATAHHWARELIRLGHDVRLIPPAYAKAYVRRGKNDAADAAAICARRSAPTTEVGAGSQARVSRPSMRFVAVKSEAQQAAAGLHKLRALLIKQRTMVINQLRGLMAEFGIVAAKGPGHVGELAAALADPTAAPIPAPLRDALVPMAELWRDLERRIAALDRQILDWGRSNATFGHLITIPGFGPLLASAMAAIVVHPGAWRSGRDFAASLGLVPRQDGTGGKVKLGPISKRGNGYLRALLVNGAMAVLASRRARQDAWLTKLLATKARKVAACALANKMARIAWAVMMRQEDFRTEAAA